MSWTLEDNMVDGLFFCTTLTGRREGHTPFVQAGAETSHTGAEAVKLDPCCFWKSHSRRVCAGVRDGSEESCRSVCSLPIPLLTCQWATHMLLSGELMMKVQCQG